MIHSGGIKIEVKTSINREIEGPIIIMKEVETEIEAEVEEEVEAKEMDKEVIEIIGMKWLLSLSLMLLQRQKFEDGLEYPMNIEPEQKTQTPERSNQRQMSSESLIFGR